MRFVPSLVHGLADYSSGALVLAVPVVVQEPEPARHVMMIIGTLVLLNAVLTDYRAGILPFLRLRLHLRIEAVLGALMIALPFIVTLTLPMAIMTCLFGVTFLLLAATTVLPEQACGKRRRDGAQSRRR
ncbi:hypothetical protein EV281_111121 [Rhizobium sp. BK418]|nr:hypothetical protein EV281_111121 [Rhizobium sp. BK418]